jgi:hypothetical protein
MWGHEASSAMQKRMLGLGRFSAESVRAADNADNAAAPPAAFKNNLRERRLCLIFPISISSIL